MESPFLDSLNWLTLSETTLSIPPGESANIEITTNANGYECGDYDGTIQLTTNDPENPSIEIPVNMSVLYPTAVVDESPVNFGEVGFNNTAEIQVPVTNNGCYSLGAIASLENANLTVNPDTLLVEAGDTSYFTISITSDMDEAEIVSDLVLSYNDPSNNSDTISVSATIVPDVHPIITSIEDVPGDQGGWVWVYFTRSYHDTDSLRNENYTVEILNNELWGSVGSTNGYNNPNYGVLVHTITDSSSTLDGLIDFRVIAGMEEGNFVSETVQGYSTDNINPAEPVGMTLQYGINDNQLNMDWQANSDDDLSHYVLTQNNEIIAELNTSEFNSEIYLSTGEYNFSLKAVDVHGNVSEAVEKEIYIIENELSFGNNLISIPGTLENNSSINLLENLMDIGPQVNFLLGQGVGLFNTVDGWSGNLNNVSPHEGYWLNISGSHNWRLNPELGALQICESYVIGYGNNLMSFRWGNGNQSTLDALGGEEFATENFNFILGQGVGLFNTTDGWSGNLNQLEEGKGYWVNASSSSIDFKWGFDNCANPAESVLVKEKVASQLPEEYQFKQSTIQAFYLIAEITIDGKQPEEKDLILAFNNDILVGSAVYNPEMTVLPVMGRDVSEQTVGFLEDDEIPTLRLIKTSCESIPLEADLEGFRNLLISEVASVTGSTLVIPTEYALHPAFPNPFNPVTTISYDLPKDSEISLTVYDVEGRKITTLSQGLKSAGSHVIEWSADGLPSGLYFVKLDASGFSDTQKLMLVK